MPAYSRILLPWDSQPQEFADIDPKWLARGLVFLSLGNGQYWTRERGFFGSVTTIAGAPKRTVGPTGVTTGFGATSGTGTTDRLDVGTVYMGTPAFRSIVAWVYPISNGGGGLGRVFQSVGSSGADTVPGESLFINAVNGVKLTYGRTTTVTTQTAGISGSITLNAWSCFGFTHDQTGAVSATPVCYEGGVQNSSITTNGVPAGLFNTSPYTISLGNRSTDSARVWDGQLGPIAIFDNPASGLTAKEHADLFANFWQLFAPRSIWVPVSVGGGGSAIDLTIQDATHSHAADSLTVTVDSTLAIQGAAHAHTADSLTLSLGYVDLTIADALHAHTADNLTITVSGATDLTIQDATHGHSADEVVLTLGYVNLVISDALHGHTADELSFGGDEQAFSGGWFPMPRRRTRKEIDDERRRLGILPPEVVEEVAAAPVARRRITLQDLIGKKAAAEITNVDLSQAIAASKKRKRQRDDELLLLM